MKTLLFVNACVRGEKSRTLKLSRYYIEKFLEDKAEKGEEWQVQEVNLNDMDIPLQKKELLDKREALIKAGDFSDSMFDLPIQFMNADFVVFGAPYWDLQFPAVLKIYLERCSVSGLTYIYSDDDPRPVSRCRAKGACYVMTAGGYTDGMNFGYEYVKGLLKGLFGIEKVDLVEAAGIDIIGNDADAIIRAAENGIRF